MNAAPAAPATRAGVGFVLTALITFQVGSVVAVKLLQETGSLTASALRLVLAAAVAMIVWRPSLSGRTRSEIRMVVAYGVALGGTNVALYQALDRVALGVAVAILMLGPLSVTVLKRGRGMDLLWAALALAGAVLIVHPDGAGVDTLGVAFAAIAAVSAGCYVVFGARVAADFAGGDGLALALVVAAGAILVPGVVAGGSQLLDPSVVLVGCAVAILTAVLPHACELAALRRMPTRVFGILISLEPAGAAVFGVVFLHQRLPLPAALGIALVMAAAVGISFVAPDEAVGLPAP